MKQKNLKQYHILVKGYVQGVFFRANAQKKATQLGLFGWVKNTFDGNVEIIAQGTEEKLRVLVEWCRHGPSHAKVEKVVVEEEEIKYKFHDFIILHE